MAYAVIRRPVTAEVMIQFRGLFVVRKVAVGMVFLRVVRFPPTSVVLPGRLTFEACEN
jgi:hypothetical protein